MKPKPPAGASSVADTDSAAEIRDIAARWVVRQDRRLSPEETAELEVWLRADPRHARVFERSAAAWRTFRALGTAVRRAPDAASTPPPRSRWNGTLVRGLAAAAVVALAFVSFERASHRGRATAAASVAALNTSPVPATRRLADGSVARLRGDAEIAEAFSPAERRIRLVRGEAFFSVAKDATRPFFVEVGDVTVRAVGTAFAIRFEPHAVDVLVTEGTVQVTIPPAPQPASPAATPALVGAGHRATVGRSAEAGASAVVVSAVSDAEITRALAWNESMLELAGATLGELVPAFAQRAGRRIEIGDPALGAVRIGGRFPTDDVDGLIRALEEIYEVSSERRADGTIVLRKRKP